MQNSSATARQSAPKGPVLRILGRRIWLPAPFYAALPCLYLLLGSLALVSGIYLPDPGWLLGYLLLLSTVCMHAGLWFMALRRRRRHARLRRNRAQRIPGTRTTGAACVMTDRA
jgi:hypothetical protein